MKKSISLILLLAAITMLLAPCAAFAAAGDFVPDPGSQTAYSREFIQKCESQQWLINEVERILNSNQQTLNRINRASDLDIVKSIGLKNQKIAGKIPSAIGELKELRTLFLAGNNLTGDIPAELFSLPKLYNIDLSDNLYAGSIPAGFGTMTALETLILQKNGFTGQIPQTILDNNKNGGQLKVLDLSSNKLSGKIPDDLKNMTKLTYLAISDNNWSKGELPDLSGLSSLITLSAWGCNITGSIPAYIYDMTTLQILDLADNGFTGEISGDIGKLKNLQLLALGRNELRGTIPASISELTKLAAIDLSDNYLRGLVPKALKDLYDTGTKVYLQNNYLTGTNLLNMANNEKNFTDGAASEQYQLTAKSATIQIYESKSVNVYGQLQNKSYKDNSTSKIVLLPDEYTIEYDSSKVKVEVTSDGIYVTALQEIPKGDNFTITIYIKDNDGSNYSKVTLTLTTDTVAGGGGVEDIGNGEIPLDEDHYPYIQGYPDKTFQPEGDITREEVVTMVIRALDIDPGNFPTSSYSDVKTTRWSHTYIEEANARGYVKGYPDGTFLPGNPISRAEFTVLLVRIAKQQGRPESGASLTFADVKSGAWYYGEVMTAARMGLTTGYPDGSFRPENPITRAEAVTMMNRFLGRDPNCDDVKNLICPFPDVKTTHWAYWQILEAGVEHIMDEN